MTPSALPHIGIASGGTGGHFYPALAAALELQRRGHPATLLVSGQNAGEHLSLAERQGVPARVVPSWKFEASPLKLALFPFRFLGTLWTARRILRELGCEAVLGMGSFAAVPACLAARSLRLPLFLHEGNCRPGRANRWLARFLTVRALATSLPLEAGAAPSCPCVPTGLPLRQSIVEAAAAPPPPRDELCREFGLVPERRTLLVFGGSQGARAINQRLAETAAGLAPGSPLRERLQIIHLTGQEDNAGIVDAYRQAGLPACVKPRDQRIDRAYQLADLALCRSGASTVSELALFRKPAIYIPLPSAMDDHQTGNAQAAVANGGGLLLSQPEATPARLAAVLEEWLADPEGWTRQANGLGAFACSDAAVRIADMVEDGLGRN